MRFIAHVIPIIFFLTVAPSIMVAQETDSAWFIKWERRIEQPDGTLDSELLGEVTMWLSEDRGRMYINDDRYITLTRDSVYVIDILNTHYTRGLIKNRDLIHVKKDFTRLRRAAPPYTIQESLIRKTIRGYETTQLTIDVVANHKFLPLRQLAFVTDQLPLPDSLLPMFYNAIAFVEVDVSIDFFAITDSLRERGVIPLLTKLRANVPMNTAGWITTELVTMERVAVPEGFFLPPKDYSYYELELPTEEEIWMARAIPMPGGPRKR